MVVFRKLCRIALSITKTPNYGTRLNSQKNTKKTLNVKFTGEGLWFWKIVIHHEPQNWHQFCFWSWATFMLFIPMAMETGMNTLQLTCLLAWWHHNCVTLYAVKLYLLAQ